MTYLWLTRWAPYPPMLGGDIDYTRELLHSLADCEPVRALAFASPDLVPPQRPEISWSFVSRNAPPRLLSLFSTLPNVAFRHDCAPYLDAAVKASAGVEAILVDFIGMFWIVEPLIRRLGPGHPPILVIDHNNEHNVRRQMVQAERSPLMKAALALDTWKAGRLERRANQAADGLVANTEADRLSFAAIVDTPGVVVMPGYKGQRSPPRVVDDSVPRRVCVMGGHQAHHKRMVLERVLEALARHKVQSVCQVDIVGPGDKEALSRKYPDFNFVGYVEDAGAYLQTVRIALIPDEIGGGFKHRALTHAFHRTPMLAVHKALAGMGFTAGVHFVGVETVDDMAKAIPALIDDFDTLNAVQAAAYEHCDKAYDWADRGRTLHAFIQQLRAQRP
ncbi:glycosyltransferase family protein [Phenylobacterium montanum]|uniref:Glycosyltransferase n=1 Tax=Phenylobacterium montanum TaxID=2823693 RepID=A0A975FW28_9CAUL|nr:glycosyltransferase [Caulobacter sp. S6]QUD86034.1 glycosyltransferase [Caulobacter sp. S6]